MVDWRFHFPALEVIKANADNGAANVILIHTNDDDVKVPAEEALLKAFVMCRQPFLPTRK